MWFTLRNMRVERILMWALWGIVRTATTFWGQIRQVCKESEIIAFKRIWSKIAKMLHLIIKMLVFSFYFEFGT